jgi:hypothetical protein
LRARRAKRKRKSGGCIKKYDNVGARIARPQSKKTKKQRQYKQRL